MNIQEEFIRVIQDEIGENLTNSWIVLPDKSINRIDRVLSAAEMRRYAQDLSDLYSYFEEFIPFADDGGGNYFCARLNGDAISGIYQWNHERYDYGLNSFTFLCPDIDTLVRSKDNSFEKQTYFLNLLVTKKYDFLKKGLESNPEWKSRKLSNGMNLFEFSCFISDIDAVKVLRGLNCDIGNWRLRLNSLNPQSSLIVDFMDSVNLDIS